jgi:hypothetical protein
MVDESTKPKLGIVEPETNDPFDLAKLRVSQDFLEQTPTKKLLTTIPVRKPGRQDFIRVHSSPAYRALVAILELKEDRENYLVDLTKVPELRGECFIATLFTAITRSGVVFLWPVRVPASDRRPLEWHVSANTAAERAMKEWLRVCSNMSLRAYEIIVVDEEKEGKIPDPKWPELSFQELCRIALRDRLINTPDHPVVRRLRGG